MDGIYESYMSSLDFFESMKMSPAMEASRRNRQDPVDIRQMTDQEYTEMEDDVSSNGENIDNSGNIDTDLSDIPGGDSSSSEEGSDDFDPTGEEDSEGDDGTDSGDDFDPTGEGEDSEEMADDESVEDGENLESPDDQQLDYRKRVQVHKNTIAFLTRLENSKESFDQKFNRMLPEEQSKDYHRIIKCFDSLINMTKDILKTKFIDGKYQNLIKYYVALNCTYDLIVRMVDKFVNQYYTEKQN